MKGLRGLALLLALAFMLTGCAGAEPKKESAVGFYLDTTIMLTAYVNDTQVLQDALGECGRYETLLSRTVEGSDVWRVNHAGGAPVEVSGDTIEIIETARKVSKMSGGAFDITIAPASTLWDFTSGAKTLPDAKALADAASRVDYRLVEVDGNTVTLPEGMMIDLGGIAKGYIADAVKQYLVDRGVKSAILSFGGNIVAIGVKPDGSPWKVGIQDIDKPTGEYMAVSRNYGGSTVTSGIYERGFELDGAYYHHIPGVGDDLLRKLDVGRRAGHGGLCPGYGGGRRAGRGHRRRGGRVHRPGPDDHHHQRGRGIHDELILKGNTTEDCEEKQNA